MESTQLEINVVPAHDSPKNILNLLNDDCIQVILRKLTNIWDFFSAAEVCTRFQENAKQCFPRKFKEVKIDNRKKDMDKLPTKRALNFLQIFGHLIHSLNLIHYRVFKMTLKYCRTLSKLEIAGINKNIDLSKFQSLEELKISRCSIINLYLPTTLKVLKLESIKLEYRQYKWNPKQMSPQLKNVEFCDVLVNKSINLSKFQSLEVLDIDGCSISKLNLPKTLKVLKLCSVTFEHDQPESKLKQGLSKSKNVKFSDIPINKSVDLSHSQFLEKLEISYCSINKLYLPTTLKTLELYHVKLENDRFEWNPKQKLPKLEDVKFRSVNINDTQFITFLSFTPKLQRLEISGCVELFYINDNLSHVFAAIGNLVSNLVDLKISVVDRDMGFGLWNYGINWAPMAQLKCLKCLHWYFPESIKKLIELFAEHRVPIEELKFRDTDTAQSLSKLKQLKKLTITLDEIIPSHDFVQMAKDISALTEIYIKTRTITPQQIVEALEYGRNLNKIHIITNFFDMNGSEFYAIWHRLTKCYLKIIALRGDIDFPDCTAYGYEDKRISIETGKFVCQNICESDLKYYYVP